MRRIWIAILAVTALAGLARAQDPEQAARQRHGRALEAIVESTGDQPLRQFLDQDVAPALRDSLGEGALLERLTRIRAACRGSGGTLWQRTPDGGTRVRFLQGQQETPVLFHVEAQAPYRVVALDLEPTRASADASPPIPPFDWNDLSARLDEEAKAGFAGTVLVVHGGDVVLHRGYGFADRERKIPNGPNTIYAIGSVPIDFTRAAILKLEEMGKLRTSDRIGKYLANVPPDKQSMTIDHLMNRRSGLPNFHHIVGVDADPDLSWIDRETAIRRILGASLLFAPGQGEAHSHSAWVLLAAIVEIVSGRSYGDFLRENFFVPAGMTSTGLHEDAAGVADSELAIGYGLRSYGKINTPKYWGKTSWLVMGSGGMQSTPLDLYRWITAIRTGKTLSKPEAAKYWSSGPLAGGDDRGFFCLYTEGPDDLMIFCTNAHSQEGDRVSSVARRLVELVQGPAPAFTLGVELSVKRGSPVSVLHVAPGSAAERDGLEEGDILVSANGVAIGDPPLAALGPMLRTGQPITFDVLRAGASLHVTVKPNPRP
ncbi:MAG: serine hydrolase [bacterium]